MCLLDSFCVSCLLVRQVVQRAMDGRQGGRHHQAGEQPVHYGQWMHIYIYYNVIDIKQTSD